MENAKKIIGYVLLGFSFLGMIVCISYTFDLDWVDNDYQTFGRGNEGGASNAPIFYGLCALAGAYLISVVKDVQSDKHKLEAATESNTNESNKQND